MSPGIPIDTYWVHCKGGIAVFVVIVVRRASLSVLMLILLCRWLCTSCDYIISYL